MSEARSRPARALLDEKRTRLAAADLLARRAWTTAELRRRLIRRGAPTDVANSVVDDLTGRGYLDDGAFARHWIESRAARGFGAQRLRAELLARGVARGVVDAALVAHASEADLEAARAAGRRRLAVLRRGRPDRVATRLRDHLRRRGYPDRMVLRVVRELTGIGADD